MSPSYMEMSLEQQKRALGLLLSRLKDGVLPLGSLTIVADEIGVACSTICHTEFQQSLKEIPQHRHKTYRSTVKAIGVSLNRVQ